MDIRISGVNKKYGQIYAIKDVNVTIVTNEFTTLLGPSGCGKTTLLRIIAGLEEPDSGEIFFDKKCVFSINRGINVKPQERQLGMVFQDFALWPHMNVFENVAFALKARGQKKDMEKKVKSILQTVKLSGMEKRYPHQMSGGQQQRVAFARAVAANPGCVLFDEPLSALDAVLRDEMRFEICSMVGSMNLTAVYVTHDQIEAMSMSDKIIVMNQGEVLQEGTPEDVYHQPKSEFVMSFIGRSNWFPDRKMAIRPEDVLLEPISDGMSFKGIIEGIGYQGDKYEISIIIKNVGKWIVFHSKRLPVGKEVEVFFTSDSIINL